MADASHDATRADLGIAEFSDARSVAGVDTLMAYMLEHHGRALIADDSRWLDDYRWFADACDRLSIGRAAVAMDG